MSNNLLSSHFNKLLFYLLFTLIHLACFLFTTSTNNHQPKKNKKFFPSSWSFLKRIFSPSKHASNNNPSYTTSFSSPTSSTRNSLSGYGSGSGSISENPFLPLRNDIFPCPICGEIFLKSNLLEHHKTTKHAVSELRDSDDSGKNIVLIIFKTGWPMDHCSAPKIHRILKVYNSPKSLARFEEYRDTVKIRAARVGASWRDERCLADGNELLRFHCTTLVCNLGKNGNSSVCNQPFCSACGIIRVGFSPKLDGISTFSSSWHAHVAIPDDVEDEFAFMNVKRVMLVCRVIAGRVGCDPLVTAGKEDSGFDSLVGRVGSGQGKFDDELVVFNPKAVLPCFLIVYSV